MRYPTRRATAIGATAFVLAGSAVLGAPGTASAETKTVPCGSSITAKPGDHVVATTPLLGIPLDLGFVGQASQVLTGTINALLGTVCKVTVTVVNTVVSPIPVVGPPAADAINQGVSDGTNKLTDTVNKVGGVGQAPQNPGAPGSPQTPGGDTPGAPGAPAGGPAPGVTIPDANSPVIGGGSAPEFGGLPGNFFTPTGWAAMRDYGGIPVAGAGAFSPSPALRYGNQIPGYAPQFGLLGSDGKKNSGAGIQNAGQAEALPYTGESSEEPGLPVLIAVLALSGVSAWLVRTWVLRRMAATV
ncbi:hypothetical protein [Amycolatopsis sp. NPDC059657]|uniref:hypothetical protein n=1 Tax=Amycolatopsis sp. NPDC059657 TaxID=3346899 RepID=UPI0036715D88